LDKPELLVITAGLGKKTAEKIVLGLSGKIKEILKGADRTTLSDDSEIIEALVTLGFSSQQIRQALQQVSPEITNSEEKIKEVLKVLGGRHP
jgi:Holliday junction resolvasome RuvABC DNA-binding subunit